MKTGLTIVYGIFLIFICMPAASSAVVGGVVRSPAWAGKFYPDDPKELTTLLQKLTHQAESSSLRLPDSPSRLKALIMPHAGYIYSGLTAAHASLALGDSKKTKIVLIGPDHRVGFRNCAISSASAWNTPLGTTPVSSDTRTLAQYYPGLFKPVPESETMEHSLEVILPFLQYYLDTFSLTPVTAGQCDPVPIASALLKTIPGITTDPLTLIVASTDLSHFLSYDDAVAKDKRTLELILNFDTSALKSGDNRACGLMPVLILLEIAKASGWKPVLLHYSNSGDTQGDKSRVVGYTTIAFYGGNAMKPDTPSDTFNETQGRVLLKLARNTICRKLGKSEPDISVPDDAIFNSRRGTFVTLKINNQLRGCIGNLSSESTVIDGIKRNALNAAFNDYRFSPLSADELDHVEIEVSILSEPATLQHTGGQDLVSKLRPGKDGVIIRMGHSSATFLPQVWEQLPEPESFLSHLCSKAGLPANSWESEHLEVSTYQVQYFEEHETSH